MKAFVLGIVMLLACLAGTVTCKADEARQRTIDGWESFFIFQDAKLSSLTALRGRPTEIRGKVYLFAGALADGSNEGGTLMVSVEHVEQVRGIDIVVGIWNPNTRSLKTFPWLADIQDRNNPRWPELEAMDKQIRLLDAQIEASREQRRLVAKDVAAENRKGGVPMQLGVDRATAELVKQRDELQARRDAIAAGR